MMRIPASAIQRILQYTFFTYQPILSLNLIRRERARRIRYQDSTMSSSVWAGESWKDPSLTFSAFYDRRQTSEGVGLNIVKLQPPKNHRTTLSLSVDFRILHFPPSAKNTHCKDIADTQTLAYTRCFRCNVCMTTTENFRRRREHMRGWKEGERGNFQFWACLGHRTLFIFSALHIATPKTIKTAVAIFHSLDVFVLSPTLACVWWEPPKTQQKLQLHTKWAKALHS